MVSRQPTLRFVLGYVNVITICFLSVHVHLFETMNKIKIFRTFKRQSENTTTSYAVKKMSWDPVFNIPDLSTSVYTENLILNIS